MTASLQRYNNNKNSQVQNFKNNLARVRNKMPLRLGILGTARIANKNVCASRESGEWIVAAVASRSHDKAASFAASHGSITAYGSYAELIADPSIDAIYCPLPTTLHLEWVGKALAAGKHVLVEKPAAVTSKDLQTLFDSAARAHLVLLDGVMFHHSARLPAVRAALGRCGSGALKMTSSFEFQADDAWMASNIRTSADCDPLGCLGDLSLYSIRMALFVKQYALPATVSATAEKCSPDGTPTYITGVATWADGSTLRFQSSFHTPFHQDFAVEGAGGVIALDDFCRDRRTTLPGQAGLDSPNPASPATSPSFTFTPTGGAAETVTSPMPLSQEGAMWARFAAEVGVVRAGGAPSSEWREVAMKTQAVVDAAFVSLRSGGAEVAVVAL